MAKNAKKTTPSKKTPSKKVDTSNALGRPGTVARFFRETILAKPSRENAEIVAMAHKKYPKAGIASHWASWYRAEIVRNFEARGFATEKTAHRAAYGE